MAIGTPWNPGTVLGALVGSQLGTGALLGLHYSPGARTAHHSVAQLPREGHHGRGARLGHSGAASTVLLGALGHGGRGALHGSHRGAAGALYLGPGAYGALAALASLGYTLPLGALGYWGATVTTSLPGVGMRVSVSKTDLQQIEKESGRPSRGLRSHSVPEAYPTQEAKKAK